jgi:hypothetical protein
MEIKGDNSLQQFPLWQKQKVCEKILLLLGKMLLFCNYFCCEYVCGYLVKRMESGGGWKARRRRIEMITTTEHGRTYRLGNAWKECMMVWLVTGSLMLDCREKEEEEAQGKNLGNFSRRIGRKATCKYKEWDDWIIQIR